MRTSLLTSAVLLGLAMGAPAFAQGYDQNPPSPQRLIRQGAMNPATGARWGHEPGIGESLPCTTHASNITPQDTRSIIAPCLPRPPSQNWSTAHYLDFARQALARGQTGLAQSTLEDAMTARLNADEIRAVDPSGDPVIGQIQAALDDLAQHRFAAVDGRIAAAMSDVQVASEAPAYDQAYGGPPPAYNEYGGNGE